MKKLISLLSLSVIFSFGAFAQTPQAISYQAIARNATGDELVSQAVGIKISVHTGTATGTVEYSETHHDTTNQFGLFTLQIGNGTPVTGTFSNIDWSTGNKFLQVELDPTGGTAYSDMGTSQLVSVPYALYAEKANINLQAGNGIQISGNTITNSLPDVPVSITGSGGSTVTGSYPNFNISSSNLPNAFNSNVYYDSVSFFMGATSFQEIYTSPSFSQANRLILHLSVYYSENLSLGVPLVNNRNWFDLNISAGTFIINTQFLGIFPSAFFQGCNSPDINAYIKGNGTINSIGIITSITLQIVDINGNALTIPNLVLCTPNVLQPITNNTLHPK